MIPLSNYVLHNILLYTLAILQCKKAAIQQRSADNNDIESSREVAERKRKRRSGSRPKKNENLEKCVGRREAQHSRWFRGCVNVSERRSPCRGCLLCPRNVGSGGTPERKKWGLEQVPFFCLCSIALATSSFLSHALFSWELGTTRFRLRPRGPTCMYVFMSMDQCCYFFAIFFLCLFFNVIFVEDRQISY